MSWKHFMGTVTIVLIVGGTIYAIKKSLEQSENEEGAMTVEDAQALVYGRMVKEELGVRDQRRVDNNGEELADEEEEYEDEEIFDDNAYEYDDEMGTVDDHITFEMPITKPLIEEDKTLRHEPNSIDARNQYIRMELAEWSPADDVWQTLHKLFDFQFNPKNDGDHDLRNHIIDYRMSFFGSKSRWITDVTIADVILHYARLANYNYNESVRYWAEYILEFNELHYNMHSRDLNEVIESLNNHVYFNEDKETFGLFGLTKEQFNQAIAIASRNIDISVTYEIEFNEFLKGCI